MTVDFLSEAAPQMKLRALCLALAVASPVQLARADFRVFESNAPQRPSPPPTGLGALLPPAVPAPTTPEEPAATETPVTTETPVATEPPETPDAADAPVTPATETRVVTEPPSPAVVPAPRPFLDDHRWLDITGFLQPGYIARLENTSEGISAGVVDDTFWLQRARIGLRAQLFSWLRARFEIDFAPTAVLQDAFIDVTPHQAFNVRAGQFIVPFLRSFSFNEVNLGFLDRALYTPQTFDRGYIRYLAPRDIGLMVYGSVGERAPDHHDPVFEYQLAMMSGSGPNLPLNEDSVFLYAARMNLHLLGVPVGADAESDIARNHDARVAVAAAAYSNCDDRGNWNRGFTVDGEFRYEGIYASAAFVWFRNGRSDGAFLADSPRCQGETGPTPGTSLDFVSRGAHVQAQWVLPRFWSALGTPLDSMDLELLTRFDWVDANSPFDNSSPLFGGGSSSPDYIAPPNYTDSDNPPSRWRLTFGLNFFPTGQQTLKLGLNYQLNREIENVVTGMGTFRGVSNDILWVQATIAL